MKMNETIQLGEISIRVGNAGDVGFIDALQKKNNKAVGWMPFVQLENYVAKGKVLVAEILNSECGMLKEDSEAVASDFSDARFFSQPSLPRIHVELSAARSCCGLPFNVCQSPFTTTGSKKFGMQANPKVRISNPTT